MEKKKVDNKSTPPPKGAKQTPAPSLSDSLSRKASRHTNTMFQASRLRKVRVG